MTYEGEVTVDSETIVKRAGAVLKAIDQSFSTARACRSSSVESRGWFDREATDYALVVTYKDLLIGNGKDFYACLAAEAINQLIRKYDGEPPIPMDNMYFMSIDDFELLAQAVHSGRIGLGDFLSKAVEADIDPQRRSFYFRDYRRTSRAQD